MWQKIKPYVFSIAIALAVGGVSSLLTQKNQNLYEDITKPPLTPPSWVFPVVWSILFILMGISAALIVRNRAVDPRTADRAISVYAVSLAFNFIWSILFFNGRVFLISFLWLLVLWGLILATIFLYRKIKPIAAWLQIPYLVWVSFAGYLNFAVWYLNH